MIWPALNLEAETMLKALKFAPAVLDLALKALKFSTRRKPYPLPPPYAHHHGGFANCAPPITSRARPVCVRTPTCISNSQPAPARPKQSQISNPRLALPSPSNPR